MRESQEEQWHATQLAGATAWSSRSRGSRKIKTVLDEVRELLDDWDRRMEANPASANRARLSEAARSLQQQIGAHGMNSEVVHAAAETYIRLDDPRSLATLLEDYLVQDMEPGEEAWTRWNLVDCLALLRRCDDAVQAHNEFLNWAKSALSPERLPWVMEDATQALCWLETGKVDEWLAIFRNIVADSPPSHANRLDRFLYARTAAVLLTRLERLDEAFELTEQMFSIADEDREWEPQYLYWVTGESLIRRAEIQLRQGDVSAALSIADELRTLFDSVEADPSSEESVLKRIRSLEHNLAAVFYRARIYDIAIPLFERAIAAGVISGMAYLWLAASLRATNEQDDRVFDLLRKAAAGIGPRMCLDKFMETPEFRSVSQQPEFRFLFVNAS